MQPSEHTLPSPTPAPAPMKPRFKPAAAWPPKSGAAVIRGPPALPRSLKPSFPLCPFWTFLSSSLTSSSCPVGCTGPCGRVGPCVQPGWGAVSGGSGSPQATLQTVSEELAPWVPRILGAFLPTYSEHVTGDRDASRGFRPHSVDAVAMIGLPLPSDTAPPGRGDRVFLGWVGLKEGAGEPPGCPAPCAEGTPLHGHLRYRSLLSQDRPTSRSTPWSTASMKTGTVSALMAVEAGGGGGTPW